jgi:hypothetical protein
MIGICLYMINLAFFFFFLHKFFTIILVVIVKLVSDNNFFSWKNEQVEFVFSALPFFGQ